jgi:SAM-dependent methyltransferase
MKLRSQQKQWNQLALADPFWAILARPEKRHGRWDPDEFFATGREEIAAVMRETKALGYPAARGRALDFGCGAGRGSQALTGWFDHVTGVDISPAMLELARNYNRAGERCLYVLNTSDDLRQFGDNQFDFVYSRIVLQHVPPRQARRYIREFLRILTPAGLAVFQVPSHRRYRFAVHRLAARACAVVARRALRIRTAVEMYGVPRELIASDVEAGGARILDVGNDESAGPQWQSFVYAVTKP